MDEKEWIKRIVAGDTQMFSCLVAKYERMAYTIAFRILGNKEEAEEAEPVETKAPAPGLEDLDARFEFLLADDEEEEADEGFTVPGMIETVEEVQIDLLNATFDTDIRVTERKPMPNGFEMTFYHIVDRIPKFVE